MGITDLCHALILFASTIPPGNIELSIHLSNGLSTTVYSQEDKRMVTDLLCSDRELSVKDEILVVMK